MVVTDPHTEDCEEAFIRGLAIGCVIGFGFLFMAIIYNLMFAECVV